MKQVVRQLLWCTLAAAVAPLLAYAFSGGRLGPRRLTAMFVISWIFATSIAVPLEYTLHRVVPKLRGRPAWLTLPLYAVVLVAFALAGTLFGAAVICGVGIVPWVGYGELFRSAVQVSLVLTFLFGIGGMATSQLSHRLNESNKRLRQKEEEERKARAMATEARLASLESRVHPHFLFNAINSILALIRDDPRRAEDLLERMAALLRFSLDTTQDRLVPLDKELTIVRDYLEIEQARFGDRLRYEVDAAVGLTAEVPPLSIQTLVENSVKYAVSTRREGGRIVVRAIARQGAVEIEVEDDGPGFGETEIGAGHGLHLLRERLAGVGAFELSREVGRMTVRVRVPSQVGAAV